jgi:hypothetical protein
MSIVGLVRRLVKGSPLTAAEHDGNLNALEAAIDAVELIPGPKGDPGEKGDQGDTGPAGEPSNSLAVSGDTFALSGNGSARFEAAGQSVSLQVRAGGEGPYQTFGVDSEGQVIVATGSDEMPLKLMGGSNATTLLCFGVFCNQVTLGTGSAYGTISAAALTNENLSWALPDASGTLALTTDIPAAYSLPTAASTVLGGVKIGGGVTITEGVISVSTDYAASSHTHGNLTNDGKIGTTSGLPIKTGSSGVIEAGAFGTAAGEFCQGNDSRLSDSRTPTAHASSHQTGGADVIANVVTSPSQITANQNNYNPGSGDIFRLDADAARNITGIVAAAGGVGIMLINVGSHAITLKHASTDSTDVNRFLVPWAGDYVLAANGGAAVLIYDGTTDRWRVV